HWTCSPTCPVARRPTRAWTPPSAPAGSCSRPCAAPSARPRPAPGACERPPTILYERETTPMTTMPRSGAALMDLAPVMPLAVADGPEAAVPLARALVAGGVPGVEITLRPPEAMAAIERVAAEVPEAVVGAGTVTTPEQAGAAASA